MKQGRDEKEETVVGLSIKEENEAEVLEVLEYIES